MNEPVWRNIPAFLSWASSSAGLSAETFKSAVFYKFEADEIGEEMLRFRHQLFIEISV